MKTFKEISLLFLRIGISIILLVILFKVNKINIYDLWDRIKNADRPLLLLGFFILLFSYIFCLVRWQMLLEAANIDIPFKRIIIAFAGGIFFSNILPSTIGGDFMRTADLAIHTKKTKEIIATVFLDRLSGYIGVVIVILLAFLFGRQFIHDRTVVTTILIIIALLVTILLVLFNSFIYTKITRFLDTKGVGKVIELIKNLHHEIHIFRHQKKVILNNLILSLLTQVISPISIYFIALSLGIKIKIIYFFIFLPIIGAILLLPISIAGIGLREQLFKLYFGKVGVTPQLSVALSLLSFSFALIYGAIGGLIYVLTLHHRRI